MVLLQTRFGIDELMLEMMRLPAGEVRLGQLQDWMSRLTLSDDLVKRHTAFCSQSYRRQLLCRTPRFDLLILCWQPGQSSTIHDHGDSLNVTRIWRGELTSRLFDVDRTHRWRRPAYPPQLQTEVQLHAGEIAAVDRHQIHQLANTASQNLITLHLYARPLHAIQVYHPNGCTEQRPVHNELDACA